jgi:hypothetical protein
MDVYVNKNKKIIEWKVGERIITIHNEHILYAFKHGKNMLMVKEKYEMSESGFSTYDEEGNIIFSYKYLSNSVTLKNSSINEIDGKIIAVDYEEEKCKLVVLVEKCEKRTLLLYDENCNFIAEILPPGGYIFVSLKNNDGNIMVEAHGTSDMTKDEFGRNDWNFMIDFDNFYVEKNSITQ